MSLPSKEAASNWALRTEVSVMWRWCLVITTLMAGCLPEAIVDPATCTIDSSLEGTWLEKGLSLSQCRNGDVEYGPGTQYAIYLVKPFDERCYLITALKYYLAEDGRLGIFGTGNSAPLSQWRAWLAPIGARQYLICNEIKPAIPEDPNQVKPPGNAFSTFEIERIGTAEVRLTPVIFPDMLERLGGAMSAEEYARRLAEYPRDQIISRITANPDAAAPGDPGPIIVHRMQPTSELHVQRALETFHIVDPLRRTARLNASQEDKGK